MAGIDEFTKLMLHCNGTDASTTFLDDSASAHTVTAQADAQVDTAEFKFGGASALFDGSSDRLDIPDSEDWNFGSGDFTIDFWAKFNVLGSTSHMCSQWEFGNNKSFSIRKVNTNVFDLEYRTSGGSNFTSSSTFILSDLDFHHYAVVRDGNTLRFFVDGIAEGTDDWTGVILNNATRVLHVSSLSDGTQAMNGWIDELRISKGIARWTSNFTPATEEYTVDITESQSETLEITDTIEVTDTTINESDNLEITDVIEIIDTTVQGIDNLQISDSIFIEDTTIQESDVFQITDSIELLSTNLDAKFISKIISINPLIFVTDTDPIEIIKVDTTDPENLTWIVQTVPGISSAKDVAVNTANDFIYIAGNAGQVVKVEIADLGNQTIINVNDIDDLLTIETNSNFGITYASTENNIGELYVIDERETFLIDSDFQVISPQQFLIDSDFNIINTFKMDCDFQVLSEVTFLVATDFKTLTKPTVPIPPSSNIVDSIDPIDLLDFQVFIDNVELEDTDLILNSITITHSEAQQSNASFQLSRKHDQLNTTLQGNFVEITNQNNVEIKIKGITEFNGQISELNCQYNNDREFIEVNALAIEKVNQFNNITLSLPSLNSRLSLYDILIQNPRIFYGDTSTQDSDNDIKKFKGIRVNLGTIISQIVTKVTINDVLGLIADAIQVGNFNPLQNWTYFWGTIGAENFGNVALGDTKAIDFFYIGTSLAPVSEDLWNLTNASHHRQRIYDDEVVKLGDGVIAVSAFNGIVDDPTNVHIQLQNKGFLFTGAGIITDKFKESRDSSELELTEITGNQQQEVYDIIEKGLGFTIGEAPFEDISVRNGILVTTPKLTDEPDRLSSIKEAGFNFVEYAKEVAILEFEKLLNINGNILPDTTCTFNLTVDAYLYYRISLLTRINVDNTTESNIYNNQNGFPVSVKSITITSADRRVSLEVDNIKSTKELEEIDGEFPNEEDDEYNEKEQRVLIAIKTDMRTRLDVN